MSIEVIELKNKPCVLGYAAVAGKKEANGPLKDLFDIINLSLLLFGQKYHSRYNAEYFWEAILPNSFYKFRKVRLQLQSSYYVL